MNKWKVTRLAFDALLIAACAALGYFKIDLGVSQLTLENLPIIIGALMYGPVDGLIIGIIGTFLSQLLRWGLDATTVLWIIPYGFSGVFVGLFRKLCQFKKRDKKGISRAVIATVILMIVNCILVTALNTLMTYICYKYVYFTPTEAIFVALPGKILWAVCRAIIFAIITPAVMEGLRTAKLYQYQ